MNAILFNQFGHSSVLAKGTVSTPNVGPNDVLIKITHTSVNPVDWKIREGYLQGMLPHQLPIIPGWDAAGVVVAQGDQAKKFKLNQRVFAYARLPEVKYGTYAEYISLPESYLAAIPENLTNEAAAGIPLVGLTAWQGLTEHLQLSKGEVILITAGAGGVGSLAIQFAKLIGATVIATASSANHSYLKSLGADIVIDYTQANVTKEIKDLYPAGIDAVFDGAGGHSLVEAMKSLKTKGKVVSIVETPPQAVAEDNQLQATFHFVYPDGKALASIVSLFEQGKLQVPSFTVQSVLKAAELQDENQQRHVRGKTVLAIDFH